MDPSPVEYFPSLTAIPGVRHAFTLRHPGLDVQTDRDVALQRLERHHRAALHATGLGEKRFVTATQVHGAGVGIVRELETPVPIGEFDGMVTARRDVVLGIYVADCCAVYLVDPEKRAIGLVHSGKKGTEQGISQVAIRRMQEEFGSLPADLVVQLSPCIRPPNYEWDFAAEIVRQCREAGVEQVFDSGQCTTGDPERYYSYRKEQGRTGRMVALLALD
jgi:copper oxidase (laccase) domain-containing protein